MHKYFSILATSFIIVVNGRKVIKIGFINFLPWYITVAAVSGPQYFLLPGPLLLRSGDRDSGVMPPADPSHVLVL